MKVVVIDDEPLARLVVKEYLEGYEVSSLVECEDGFEGVKAIMQHQPDLVFLDVQMPKINGFEMLELLDQPPPVIFTTAFDEHAIRAFDQNAVDYLLKPFSKDRFDKAMSRFLEMPSSFNRPLPEDATAQDEQRIVVRTGSQIRIIPLDQVYFIEAADDYAKIHTNQGSYLKKKTMTYYEKSLDSRQFVRVHRSFIINIRYISSIEVHEKDSYTAMMTSGGRVPISKPGYAKLKSVLEL